MDIYIYRSTKDIIEAYISEIPAGEKKGINQKIAKALNIFPSYLSLILKGERSFNLDQALLLSRFFGLKKVEQRYLFLVVELERAQTQELREEIASELDDLVRTHHQIGSLVDKDDPALNQEELLIFFSSWEYSTVYLLPALTNGKINLTSISHQYQIDKDRLKEVVNFLLKSKLWIKNGDVVDLGARRIHLDEHMEILNIHHRNWRLKAQDLHKTMNRENELAYSLTIALSQDDALKVKSVLLDAVKNMRKIADPSESEVLYCFNLDWLKI